MKIQKVKNFFLNRKRINYFLGHIAELMVVLYLKLSFFSIICRRYKSKLGEIDIIASRANKLFFIEVKFRSKSDMILYSISPFQLSRIKKAAEYFLACNANQYAAYTICFDAYFLSFDKLPIRLRNIF